MWHIVCMTLEVNLLLPRSQCIAPRSITGQGSTFVLVLEIVILSCIGLFAYISNHTVNTLILATASILILVESVLERVDEYTNLHATGLLIDNIRYMQKGILKKLPLPHKYINITHHCLWPFHKILAIYRLKIYVHWGYCTERGLTVVSRQSLAVMH